MITIRVATKDDAELIAGMSRQTFYDTFAAHNTKENMDRFLSETFNHDVLVAEVGASDNIFLLAYEGDEPVGYARLRDNNIPPQLAGADALEIARLYAVKDAIGKGVGKALMQYSIDMAIEKNKRAIWLGVWQENHRAIRFYQQWGFEKFSTHVFMLGDDAQQDWLMKKMLKSPG